MSVMQELREVLREHRETKGSLAGVADNMGRSENTVRRYEKKESSPAYGDVDDLVAAYAETTGVSVFDLWDEAIERAKKGSESKPSAADAARRALRKPPPPPRRKRHPGS